MLVLALHDLAAFKVADVTAAMSTEALLGTDRAFAADLVGMRPQPGQAVSAANLTRLLAGSAIVASHRYDDPRVQDAYSLRCAPQVNGARSRHVGARGDGRGRRAPLRRSTTRSCCPTAAWSRAGTSTARRWRSRATSWRWPPPRWARSPSGAPDRMLDQSRSYGLPPFLTEDAGVNSGLMLAQYTQAAMVAENRRLAVPASTDSLPTSAMQEDHVSMGWGAARKLRTVVGNLGRILAVELTCAARALDLRAPLEPAEGTAAARAAVRAAVPGPGPDRWLAPSSPRWERLVTSGAVVEAVRPRSGARVSARPSTRRAAPSSPAAAGPRRRRSGCS